MLQINPIWKGDFRRKIADDLAPEFVWRWAIAPMKAPIPPKQKPQSQ
jgi:hypothetical protein